MNLIIKWIIMLLVGGTLLIALTAWLLPQFIDPNDYRSDIARLTHEQTGLILNIQGPISWSIFPWLGLSINSVSVGGINNSPLAELESVEASVKLLPLLRKKVEVRSARLIGLNLSLVRDNTGLGNWQVSKPQKPQPTDHEAVKEKKETKKASLIALNVDAVEITGLKIEYHDQQSGGRYIINQANIEAGAIADQTPFDVNFNAVISSNKPDLTLKIHLYTQLTYNLKEQTYTLDNLNMTAQPDLTLSEKVDIKGKLHFQQAPLAVQGKINVTQFNPHKLLSQINVNLPIMASKSALQSLALESQFESDGNSLNMQNIDITLDDFNINGNAKIADFETKAITFMLAGNDLNLDNYLPPTNAVTTQPSNIDSKKKEQSSSNNTEQPLIPEEQLRNLDINGFSSLASLTAKNIKLDQIEITVKATNGLSQVGVKSQFYQGSMSMDCNIDVNTKNKPKLAGSGTIKGVNLQAMAVSVPALKTIEGVMSANMKINTQGQLQSILIRNLNGTAGFQVDQGAFTAINFDKLVCQGIAKIRNKKLNKTDWKQSTDFQNLSGTFTIKNGVATNKNLIAKLSSLDLKGDGKINLVDQTLDYHMGLNIRGDESPDTDPACQINEDYRWLTWPVRCKGKIGEPSCGIDTERLTDTVAELAKKSAKSHIQKEFDKKVKEPLQKMLKGLFN